MSQRPSDIARDGLLDVRGAAALLKVKPVTIYDWAKRRVLPSLRLGPGSSRRMLRFDPAQLQRFMEKSMVPEREDRPAPARRGAKR